MERCIYLGFKAIEKRPRSLKRRELELCSWTQKNSKSFLSWELPLLRASVCLRRIICNSVSVSCRRDISFYHCAITHKMPKHSLGTSTEAYRSQLNLPGLFWSVQKAARNHHPVPWSHCQSGTEGKRRTPPLCTFPFSPTSPKADRYFHRTVLSAAATHDHKMGWWDHAHAYESFWTGSSNCPSTGSPHPHDFWDWGEEQGCTQEVATATSSCLQDRKPPAGAAGPWTPPHWAELPRWVRIDQHVAKPQPWG